MLLLNNIFISFSPTPDVLNQSIQQTYSGKDLKWLSRNSRIFNFVNLQIKSITLTSLSTKQKVTKQIPSKRINTQTNLPKFDGKRSKNVSFKYNWVKFKSCVKPSGILQMIKKREKQHCFRIGGLMTSVWG